MPNAARVYKVRCLSCGREFNAFFSRLCDCVSDECTFRCTNCAACFCTAPEDFRSRFWREAPQELWAQRHRVPEEDPDRRPAPARPIVVVADDSAAVRAQIARAVSHAGMRVYTAADGSEAVRLVREHTPEVLITDALMPGLDGREVARVAKSISPHTRTIVVTGVYRSMRYGSEARRDYAVDEYVTKPVPMARIRELAMKYAFASRAGLQRRVARVFPTRPLSAVVAGRQAFVVDLSLQGLRVTHDFPVGAVGETVALSVTDETGQPLPLECAVVWTSSLLLTHDGDSVAQTGLRITSGGPAIRPLVQRLVQEEIARLEANAHGIPPSRLSGARPLPTELIRHDLTGQGWTTARTVDPRQPDSGFTIASDVTLAEVQQLRESFLHGGEEDRRLIRTLAQLSIGQ